MEPDRTALCSQLETWNGASVWERLHAVLLEKLRAAKEIHWSPAVIGSPTFVPLGPKSRPGPVDRASPEIPSGAGLVVRPTGGLTCRWGDRGSLRDPASGDHRFAAHRPDPTLVLGVVGSGLGVRRWVVERSVAWLHAFRRLCIRREGCRRGTASLRPLWGPSEDTGGPAGQRGGRQTPRTR